MLRRQGGAQDWELEGNNLEVYCFMKFQNHALKKINQNLQNLFQKVKNVQIENKQDTFTNLRRHLKNKILTKTLGDNF